MISVEKKKQKGNERIFLVFRNSHTEINVTREHFKLIKLLLPWRIKQLLSCHR